MSLLASAGRPSTCSGAMYSAVPSNSPVVVSGEVACPGRPMPKSVRNGRSSPSLDELDETVGGLDVAVDDPAGVSGVERARHPGDDSRRPARFERALRVHQPVQVGAAHQAHDDEQAPVLLPRAMDRDHRRVVDRGGHARLALEAVAEGLVAGQLGLEDLEGPRRVQGEVANRVHGAHPAATEDPLDP